MVTEPNRQILDKFLEAVASDQFTAMHEQMTNSVLQMMGVALRDPNQYIPAELGAGLTRGQLLVLARRVRDEMMCKVLATCACVTLTVEVDGSRSSPQAVANRVAKYNMAIAQEAEFMQKLPAGKETPLGHTVN
jgi:hypothetical protein